MDFSDLAAYFQSAYMQEYSNWFRVEGAVEDAKEGEAKAERGGSQGTWWRGAMGPTAHPRMRLGVPRGLPRAKSCLTDPKALLTHCPKTRH